jgi:hypothetical protein
MNRALCVAIALVSASASAADKQADPSTVAAALLTLQAGDTLHLAAGTYPKALNLANLNGAAQSWITVTGPSSGPPAVFVADACCNTVEITQSSYLAIENLTVDGQHISGAFGLSAKNGVANRVHDIRVEGCTFVGQDGSQQTVAISTKTPTWGWTIARNRIIGAGTGMYLGNSDGSDPFVGGLIEGNLVRDTIGYNAEIKFQNAWPPVAGMPAGPNATIIRDNVFIKNDQPSPDGDRPNLLVDRGPAAGPGASDRFEIYGNFFLHNPRESLLQVSGRTSIHDNVMVDVAGSAIRAQDHAPATLISAAVYNNTIYAAGTGVSFGNAASGSDAVLGNLIFAATPTAGPIASAHDNLSDATANAAKWVASPSVTPAAMDFYPLAGRCTGAPLDLSPFKADTDYAVDFNGAPKGAFGYRGAYAGSGVNPGWKLSDDFKGPRVTGPPADGGTSQPDAGTRPPPGDAGVAPAGSDDGSGCRVGPVGGSPPLSGGVLIAAALSLIAGGRRRQTRCSHA